MADITLAQLLAVMSAPEAKADKEAFLTSTQAQACTFTITAVGEREGKGRKTWQQVVQWAFTVKLADGSEKLLTLDKGTYRDAYVTKPVDKLGGLSLCQAAIATKARLTLVKDAVAPHTVRFAPAK